MGNGPGQVWTSQGIGHKDQGQHRHNVAQYPTGALQHHKSQRCAGKDGHPGGLAQTLGHVMHLVLSHPPSDPAQDDQCNIDDPANGTEGLIAREFIFEHVLIERLCQ